MQPSLLGRASDAGPGVRTVGLRNLSGEQKSVDGAMEVVERSDADVESVWSMTSEEL